jgi:hypothetical protein
VGASSGGGGGGGGEEEEGENLWNIHKSYVLY